MNAAAKAILEMGLRTIVAGIKEEAPRVRDAALATVGKFLGDVLREQLPKGLASHSARVVIGEIAKAVKLDVVFPRDVPTVKGEAGHG